MELFRIFKKKQKFNDDFFGLLNYQKFKDSSKNFYEGEMMFQNTKTGILIEADENGPTNTQKEFFKKLEHDYPKIKNDIIIPFIKKEFEDTIEELDLANFDSGFEFDGISMNRNKNNWGITYYSNTMRHYISIDFQGMTPLHIQIDG